MGAFRLFWRLFEVWDDPRHSQNYLLSFFQSHMMSKLAYTQILDICIFGNIIDHGNPSKLQTFLEAFVRLSRLLDRGLIPSKNAHTHTPGIILGSQSFQTPKIGTSWRWERRAPKWDWFHQFLRILHMRSISHKEDEMAILYLTIQLKESLPPTHTYFPLPAYSVGGRVGQG